VAGYTSEIFLKRLEIRGAERDNSSRRVEFNQLVLRLGVLRLEGFRVWAFSEESSYG
jgi:hypothetical protein